LHNKPNNEKLYQISNETIDIKPSLLKSRFNNFEKEKTYILGAYRNELNNENNNWVFNTNSNHLHQQ